ncbi:hypothetical protein ACFZBE_29780 [Streptomyces sp. NPDC008061]|uniref:hypothetical protein n=1 Tax=Streptomyces sp. NPDC008061 TaxID=3364805 RepID=UPI0036ECD036
MLSSIPAHLCKFRDHLNTLFSTPDAPFIPTAPGLAEPARTGDASGGAHRVAGAPWAFDTRQFRRTLAWYIAHRPFGVVAGSLRYKHARLAVSRATPAPPPPDSPPNSTPRRHWPA